MIVILDTQDLIYTDWPSVAARHEAALKEIVRRTQNKGKMNAKEVNDLNVFAFNALVPALRKP